VWNYFRFLSGGLRYAATTGYYLTALQAEPTRYLAPDARINLFPKQVSAYAFSVNSSVYRRISPKLTLASGATALGSVMNKAFRTQLLTMHGAALYLSN
jgi:hypothetical protein